jgi:hypothetical protein
MTAPRSGARSTALHSEHAGPTLQQYAPQFSVQLASAVDG